MRETRFEKGLSLEDVYRETKIQPKILRLLEEGDWQNLPEESHLKGLIKNYGEFLGLEKEILFALFRREYKKREGEERPLWPKFPFRFLPFPNFFIILATGILLFAFVFYLAFQYFSQVLGPELQVHSPQEGAVIEGRVVEVQGRTDPDAQIYINGGKVEISQSGDFSSHLTILDEVTTIEIVARNKFGKEKKVVRTVKTP